MCWCNKKHFIVNFLHTYLWLLLITLKCKIWSLFWKRQRKCHVSLFQYRSWPEFWTIDTKLPRNDHWKVLYKVSVFYADRKSKMATTAGHRLTLDPMGKCSNAFFSETTNQTESKLDRNVHLMVLYKVKFFWSDIKWKMAATAGLSLTLDLPRMIIGRSSTKVRLFMSIGNSRWPPLQDID